ncbi:hypothetical protein B0H14DRAFT_3581707 [Mycena olivaceomarginata]|nr:hypothetical protein B0H14DRAFT_3581707 [Mycena olivaceomarginata]
MSDIPVETLAGSLGWIEDTAVLFNLRLVWKTFNAIAASMVLRVLLVTDIAQSVDGLACIQAGGTDTLNSVQEIVFEEDFASGEGYVSFGNQPQLSDFWESSIPSILKSATNLTSLTIRSNYPVGVLPAFPVAHIHLPMLAALTLDNFVLHPARADYDIAEFIVRHKATLTHLELTDCWVLCGEQGVYARPWHSLFQLFQQELVGLRSLRMLTTISGSYLWHFCGYIVLVPESRFFYYDHEAAVQARDLDDAAFESLMSTVPGYADTATLEDGSTSSTRKPVPPPVPQTPLAISRRYRMHSSTGAGAA